MCSSSDATHPGYDGAELIEFEKDGGEKLNYGHQRLPKSFVGPTPLAGIFDLEEEYGQDKSKKKKKEKEKEKKRGREEKKK